MTQERKQITGHMLACGTQIMWGATFVSTKVLLQYFIPVEVLFTRAVLAFLAMVSWGFYSALIKKIACFFLFSDLNVVCPIYWKSMKMNAAKYCFRAGTASCMRTGSELNTPISASGARTMTLHITTV